VSSWRRGYACTPNGSPCPSGFKPGRPGGTSSLPAPSWQAVLASLSCPS
jgi:hypothetical protein